MSTTSNPKATTVIVHTKLKQSVLEERLKKIIKLSENREAAHIYFDEQMTDCILQGEGEDVLELFRKGLHLCSHTSFENL